MMRKKLLVVFVAGIYIACAALWIKSATREEDRFKIWNELSLSNWREYEHHWPCWLGMDNTLKFDFDALSDYYRDLDNTNLTRFDFEREIQNEETAHECGLQMCSILHWPLDPDAIRDGRSFDIYRDDENRMWLIEQYGVKWSGGMLLQDRFIMILCDDGKAFVFFP